MLAVRAFPSYSSDYGPLQDLQPMQRAVHHIRVETMGRYTYKTSS